MQRVMCRGARAPEMSGRGSAEGRTLQVGLVDPIVGGRGFTMSSPRSRGRGKGVKWVESAYLRQGTLGVLAPELQKARELSQGLGGHVMPL